MRFLKIALSCIVASSLYADMSVQEFIYKDPRIMGMGAANSAVGGYSTALFYNPAGLIKIKKSHGVEVEVLGISATASKNIQSFLNDLNNANTDAETVAVIQKHSGEVYNANVANYSSLSYHTQNDFAYSIGLLISADLNFIPHANGSANGLLETHSRAYAGVMLGVANQFHDTLGGDVTIGIGAKFIKQNSYEAGLDTAEVVQHKNDLLTYIQNTYKQSNSGYGVDIGVLYEPYILSSLHPAIGVSVKNLGTLNFTDAYGAQPMTLNAGVSISPEVSFLDSLKIAVDYVDIFNAQQMRIRNYNPSRSNDQYDNANIAFDIKQHLRAGVSVGLVDNSWFLATVMGGWYQNSYTAGVDLQFTLLKVQAATYQEQLGSVPGQLEDRRYVVGLGIGW